MSDQIEIVEQYPDFGQCIYHFEDITSICVEEDCHSQRYLCRSCKPFHEGHKDRKNPAQIKELVQKLIKAQPKDKQMKEEISKSLSLLLDQANNLLSQISIAINILKSININQCYLYYATVSSTPTELTSYLRKCNLGENAQQIQKMANKISRLQIDYPLFTKQLPIYTEQMKNNIKIIGNSVELLVSNVTQINTMFELNKITNKSNSTVPKSNINKAPSKQASQQFITLSLADKDLYGMQIMQQLRKVKTETISKLNLYKNSIDTDGLKLILNNDLFKFTNLEELNLKNNGLDDGCIDVIMTSNLPKLKTLNLSDNFLQLNQSILAIFKQKWPAITLLSQ